VARHPTGTAAARREATGGEAQQRCPLSEHGVTSSATSWSAAAYDSRNCGSPGARPACVKFRKQHPKG